MKGIMLCLLWAGCASAGAPSTDAPREPAARVQAVTRETQICGDAGALHAGDIVRFERPRCTPLNAKSAVVRCASAEIARAEVLRVVDARCAVVRLAADAAVQPGDRWSR
jgi:hypothetical protein